MLHPGLILANNRPDLGPTTPIRNRREALSNVPSCNCRVEHTTYASYPILQVAECGRLLELRLLPRLRRTGDGALAATDIDRRLTTANERRPDKKPNWKKAKCWSAVRERQKQYRAEWNKAPPARFKREPPGRSSGAIATSGSQVSFQIARIKTFQTHKQTPTLTPKILRASARPEVSPTPSNVTRNRGAAGQPHCADHAMTHAGPYDSISDT